MRLGPDWTEKTAQPDGSFTKATAQAQLDAILQQAGRLPGLVQTGKTFREASAEWLTYCENVRDCKASTLNDYRALASELAERPCVRKAATIDVLGPDEVTALVGAADDDQDAALFHTAALVGLRMGDLPALLWRDLDFTGRTIHVRETWTQEETTTPKGSTERAVPMAEEHRRSDPRCTSGV